MPTQVPGVYPHCMQSRVHSKRPIRAVVTGLFLMHQGPYSMLPPQRSPSELVKAGTLFLSCSDHLYRLVLDSAVLLVTSWGPHPCTTPFWLTL